MTKKDLELQKKMEENGWYEIEKHSGGKEGFKRLDDQKYLTDVEAYEWIMRQDPGTLYSIIRVEITRTVLRTIRR